MTPTHLEVGGNIPAGVANALRKQHQITRPLSALTGSIQLSRPNSRIEMLTVGPRAMASLQSPQHPKTGPEHPTAAYTLDAMGNRTAEKSYDPTGALHRTHTREYNTFNELYEDINAAGTSAVTTTYGYDSNANQTSIDAPLSRNTANAFDQLNRSKQITDPNSGVTTFTYDSENDLTAVHDPRSLTTSYGYNGFGNVTQLVSPDSGTSTKTGLPRIHWTRRRLCPTLSNSSGLTPPKWLWRRVGL